MSYLHSQQMSVPAKCASIFYLVSIPIPQVDIQQVDDKVKLLQKAVTDIRACHKWASAHNGCECAKLIMS